MLVRDVSCGLKCEICGTAAYIGQEDIVFGIKHTKGWSYRMICGRCLGDRKEFMAEYGKAADRLVRMARAGSRKWQGEERDVAMGNGVFRWGKLRKLGSNYNHNFQGSLRVASGESASIEAAKHKAVMINQPLSEGISIKP